MNRIMLKKWRSLIVKRLREQKRVDCISQIKQIRQCGTVLLHNRTEISTNICFQKLMTLSHF